MARPTCFLVAGLLAAAVGLAGPAAAEPAVDVRAVVAAARANPENATAPEAAALEAVRLFYDLHASELVLQSLNETHASAYVRWNRAQQREKLGLADSVEVAEGLAKVESTRLDFFRERSRNVGLRGRLADLTGREIDKHLGPAPVPPSGRPPALDLEKALRAFDSAAAKLPAERRREARRQVRETVLARNDAWQRIVTARAARDAARRRLMRAQHLYDEERTVDIGRAMIEMTAAEAEMAGAAGAFYTESARLAWLLGRPLESAFGDDFARDLAAGGGSGPQSYTPPGGSGYEDKQKSD